MAAARIALTKRVMPDAFPPCPHLPVPESAMDWRNFSVHGEARGAAFYETALQYGNHLWQRGFAARSLLCLDRALGSDLRADEPVLIRWPLPYKAMAWLLASTPSNVFIGNPRVHFQHFADRMNEPRRDMRRWRAWACWEISRVVLPKLLGDPRHLVIEPTRHEIADRLEEFGHQGESILWRESLAYAETLQRASI